MTTQEWTDFIFWKFDNFDVSVVFTENEILELIKKWRQKND